MLFEKIKNSILAKYKLITASVVDVLTDVTVYTTLPIWMCSFGSECLYFFRASHTQCGATHAGIIQRHDMLCAEHAKAS